MLALHRFALNRFANKKRTVQIVDNPLFFASDAFAGIQRWGLSFVCTAK